MQRIVGEDLGPGLLQVRAVLEVAHLVPAVGQVHALGTAGGGAHHRPGQMAAGAVVVALLPQPIAQKALVPELPIRPLTTVAVMKDYCRTCNHGYP